MDDPKKRNYTSGQLLLILHIAHKYCMDKIGKTVLVKLNEHTSVAGYVDRIVASRIIDSKPIYDTAIQGLIQMEARLNLERSNRIGMEALHLILTATYTKLQAYRCCTSCSSSTTVRCSSQRCGRIVY